MTDLIIANSLSLVAAIFTAAANWTMSKEKSFQYQCFQCLILAVANYFFHSYAGISTLFLCAVRNFIIGRGKYTFKHCVVFMILIGVVGIAVNNNGFVGLLLVAATVVYTAGSYFAKKPMAVKTNILINQICWFIYEIFILDIVSFATELVTFVVLICSMVKARRLA